MSEQFHKVIIAAEDRTAGALLAVTGHMREMGGTASRLAQSVGMLNPVMASLASAGGLALFIKANLDAVDALNDVADATGATIESVSGLERVARLNGATLDDVNSMLVKFNASLTAAKNPTSDQAAVFARLNLSVEELLRLDPAEAMQRTAAALATFANDGDKARAVAELFGKSIKDAGPFLKDLAESGKLVATVTRQQAEEAERYNKILFALRTETEDVGRALVNNVGGALAELIRRYREAQRVFGTPLGVLKAGITQQLNAESPQQGLDAYANKLQALDAKIGNIRSGRSGLPQGWAAERLSQLEADRAEVAKVADYYRNLLNEGGPGGGRGQGYQAPAPSLTLPPRSSGSGRAAARGQAAAPRQEVDDNARSLAQYVEQLRRQVAATEDLTEAEKARDVLRSLGKLGEMPQVQELVLGLAREADAAKQAAAAQRELAEARQRVADLDAQIDRYSGRAGDAAKRESTARLEERLGAGEVFTPEELDRIVKGIAGIGTQAEASFGQADQSLEQFRQSMQETFGDTLQAALKGDFDSIERMWLDMLVRMAAQALAADLTRAVFPTLSGGASIFGSLLGAVTGGLAGGSPAAAAPAAPTVVQHVTVQSGVGVNQLMEAMRVSEVSAVSAITRRQERVYG